MGVMMEFGELGTEEFGKLDFACRNFLQSREMYERYKELGREAYIVGVRKDGEIVAAGLILGRKWHFGRKIFRVPGGWVMDYDRADRKEILTHLTREARKFCKKHKGLALFITPNLESQPRDNDNRVVEGADHLAVKAELKRLGYKELGEFEAPKWQYILGLDGQTPEKMFQAFRNGHKWEIRRAERDGVRVRELKEDEIAILKEIAAESGERHGFQDPEIDYYLSMKQAFGDKVKFVVAEMPAEKIEGVEVEQRTGYVPIAASMFVTDNKEKVYLYSGSVRKMQKYGGAHLIQWVMIQEALKEGCLKYNFYGVKPVEGNGVYRFKQGFRGHVEELIGCFVLPIGLMGKIYTSRLKYYEYNEIK